MDGEKIYFFEGSLNSIANAVFALGWKDVFSIDLTEMKSVSSYAKLKGIKECEVEVLIDKEELGCHFIDGIMFVYERKEEV